MVRLTSRSVRLCAPFSLGGGHEQLLEMDGVSTLEELRAKWPEGSRGDKLSWGSLGGWRDCLMKRRILLQSCANFSLCQEGGYQWVRKPLIPRAVLERFQERRNDTISTQLRTRQVRPQTQGG